MKFRAGWTGAWISLLLPTMDLYFIPLTFFLFFFFPISRGVMLSRRIALQKTMERMNLSEGLRQQMEARLESEERARQRQRKLGPEDFEILDIIGE